MRKIMLVIGFLLIGLGSGAFDGKLVMAQDGGSLVYDGRDSLVIDDDSLLAYDDSLLVDNDSLLADDDSLLSGVPDSLAFGKSLNDIRFAGWTEDNYYDNDYYRMIRAYIDDYNAGKIEAPSLDPYKDYLKGKFVIDSFERAILGGAFIAISFVDKPDKVFVSWVYSTVDSETETVTGYEVRYVEFYCDDETMTTEEIQQYLKEVPKAKVW